MYRIARVNLKLKLLHVTEFLFKVEVWVVVWPLYGLNILLPEPPHCELVPEILILFETWTKTKT